MSGWDPQDLARIAAADELQVASYRPDGSSRPFVTIWSVVVGGTVYVRSAYGPQNGWFRRARTSGTGRVRAGGVTAEVTFAVPQAAGDDEDVHDALDAAYHAAYDRYGQGIVGSVVGPALVDATLRVDPR